jgi:hypothetical protein
LALGEGFDCSDTLKRHERLHEKDGSPPLKRQAIINTPSSLHSVERVPLYPSRDPSMDSSMMSLPHKSIDRSIHSSGNQPYTTNILPFQTSPPFLNTPGPDLSPLSGSDFPMIFDFDIDALNQFLTSGDLNALLAQETNLATPISEVLLPNFPRASRFPRPSEAIKPAWFTNMEEKDLENEAELMRTHITYESDTPQCPKLDPETGNIDEAWRGNLSTSLVPKVFNITGPLPSSEFLVLFPETKSDVEYVF